MRAAALLALAVLAVVGIGVAVESTNHQTVPARPTPAIGAPASPSVYYGEWFPGASNTYLIEQFATANGDPLRTIAHLPGDVSDLFRGPGDSLWWSAGSGPKCTPPNGLECTPVPNTCSSVFEELTAHGEIQPVMNIPSELAASSPVPSPRGGEIAFLEGGCTANYENEHIVVRSFHTGVQWSIGADAKVCHAISAPEWDESGRHLVFAYSPSLVTPATHAFAFGETACLAPGAGRLAVVAADRPSASTSWRLADADPGCGYTTATFDAWGVAAIETCGPDPDTTTYLVQLSNNLTRTKRFMLAPESDGISLAASPSGRSVLIDEYEADSGNSGVPEDTVVPPGDQPGPYIWVDVFDGRRLQVIRRWGNISVNLFGLTW